MCFRFVKALYPNSVPSINFFEDILKISNKVLVVLDNLEELLKLEQNIFEKFVVTVYKLNKSVKFLLSSNMSVETQLKEASKQLQFL